MCYSRIVGYWLTININIMKNIYLRTKLDMASSPRPAGVAPAWAQGPLELTANEVSIVALNVPIAWQPSFVVLSR